MAYLLVCTAHLHEHWLTTNGRHGAIAAAALERCLVPIPMALQVLNFYASHLPRRIRMVALVLQRV
jgi:hypothetical protein